MIERIFDNSKEGNRLYCAARQTMAGRDVEAAARQYGVSGADVAQLVTELREMEILYARMAIAGLTKDAF